MTVFTHDRDPKTHVSRAMRMVSASVLVGVLVLALTGCGGADTGTSDGASEETTPSVSYGMAGAPKDVMVSREAIESTPTAPILGTPESAVQSYLDWISYGYRTAQPRFAAETMTEAEMVRVDAYNEYNIQKDRIINQTLDSVVFGEIEITGSSATVATEEEWTYWYVSITEPDTILSGPFKAEYDATYTLVQSDAGWVVDSLDAERLGESE